MDPSHGEAAVQDAAAPPATPPLSSRSQPIPASTAPPHPAAVNANESSSGLLQRAKKGLSVESNLSLCILLLLLLPPTLSAVALAIECAYLSTQPPGTSGLLDRLGLIRETAPFRLRGAPSAPPHSATPCAPPLRVIRGEPSLSRFSELLEQSWPLNLGIADGQPFTLFAPTNIAWRAWEASHQVVDARTLRAHFVPGALASRAALQEAGEGAMLPPQKSGQPLRVVKSGQPGVRGSRGTVARLVKADLPACGCVVHSVDSVLAP